MKRKIILNIIVFIALFAPLCLIASPPITAPTTPVVTILINIRNWLYGILVFAVAPIALIIAGYYFITAAGDAEKINKARMFVLYAIIGVLVAVMARGIVDFLRTDLTVTAP